MDNTHLFSHAWTFLKEHHRASLTFILPIILLITITGDFLISLLALTDGNSQNNTNWGMFALAFSLKGTLFALSTTLFLYFMKNIIYYIHVDYGYEFIPKSQPKPTKVSL